jgi:NAD(P)-dependent dehydrogenase (short-subunit alcohol dehydrogenase family)
MRPIGFSLHCRSGAEDAPMSAKTVVITGGTSGIGHAAALDLARQGARIVLVARDPERAEATLKQLRRISPEAGHALHLGDLSRLSDMKRVGAAIATAEPRIDVLVNNAGALFDWREEVEGGLEKTFALDHLSYFVLTDALLNSLKAADRARIVSTSSEGHRFATLDFDDLQGQRGYRGWRAYCRAKLANVLFTRELARRLAGTGVTATCFHPGFVASRFADETEGLFRPVFGFAKSLFAISPEKGAETLVYLATSQEVEGQSGGYYSKRRLATASRAGQDDDAARRLWDVSAEMTGVGA